MNDPTKIGMYECMGGPVKECVGSWLNAIRDPMTDPRWGRKQRLKKAWSYVVSILKKATIGLIGLMVLKTIVKVIRNK